MSVNFNGLPKSAQGLGGVNLNANPAPVDNENIAVTGEAHDIDPNSDDGETTVLRTMIINVDDYGTPHYKYIDDGHPNVDILVRDGEIIRVFDYDNPEGRSVDEMDIIKNRYGA